MYRYTTTIMADTPQIAAVTKSISVLESTNEIPDYVTPLDTAVLKTKPVLPVIDYTNLDFSSIKLQLVNLLKANAKLFGKNIQDFSDPNTVGMFLNTAAFMGQMLSYHTDSMVNELYLDNAQSSMAVSKLLNMFAYKPSRPQAGLLLLSITRNKSTAVEPTQAAQEDAAEILVSTASERLSLTFSGESFELVPAKEIDGILQPDIMGDLSIPAYVSLGGSSVTEEEVLANTYLCFALTGTTHTEVYSSNGEPNQMIYLSNSPVNDSKIIVKVDNELWSEVAYLSTSSFTNTTTIKNSGENRTPYMVANLPYSSRIAALTSPKNTVVAITYDNIVDLPDYLAISKLTVPYRLGIIVDDIDTQNSVVPVLLYHQNYIWGGDPDSYQPVTLDPLSVRSDSNQNIYWEENDILYLAAEKAISITVGGITETVTQPIIVSETQLLYARKEYTDLIYLREHPEARIAVGRALSNNTVAWGISADIYTITEADKIYEMSWDGNFAARVKFGNGVFGKIPEGDKLISITYRTNDLATTGALVEIGAAKRTLRYNSIDLSITNNYASSPSDYGESPDMSKKLVTRFFSAQERAISGEDYIVLGKRHNPNYKLTAELSQAEADGSVVKIYSLARRKSSTKDSIETLTTLEKYMLRKALLEYSTLGVSLEIVDGILRKLDMRLDVRSISGYTASQIKSDLTKVIASYFDLDKLEMGIGLSASDLLKTISKQVSGIRSINIYLGGTTINPDGSVSNIKEYKMITDIPSYLESEVTFPSLSSASATVESTLDNVTTKLKAYEFLYLNELTINVAG